MRVTQFSQISILSPLTSLSLKEGKEKKKGKFSITTFIIGKQGQNEKYTCNNITEVIDNPIYNVSKLNINS